MKTDNLLKEDVSSNEGDLDEHENDWPDTLSISTSADEDFPWHGNTTRCYRYEYQRTYLSIGYVKKRESSAMNNLVRGIKCVVADSVWKELNEKLNLAALINFEE